MHKHKIIAILACSALTLAPLTAAAYVGPGAGLSLLGALWALIVAVATALVFLFAWPIRRMRRRKREAMELEEQEREQLDGELATDPAVSPATLQPHEKREARIP